MTREPKMTPLRRRLLIRAYCGDEAALVVLTDWVKIHVLAGAYPW